MESTQEYTITSQREYCLYARKSSEDDERQAMSIDSQVKEMCAIAAKSVIFIKEIRKESHSAKMSGQRPVFKELISDIYLGKFNAILTWNADRLSRNAGDLGALVDLMDQGKLQEIKTYSQTFHNTPNDKFLLMILCSQAKLENDNRSTNVLRGMRNKCEMGWRPGAAPLGYMNRAFGGVRDIIIDPSRVPTIKEAFERVAYMYHSGRMIKEWFDARGFTTRKGKRMTISMVYLMLKNPFYYGYFEYPKGKLYKGLHEPIITKELFDDAQQELGAPKKGSWGAKVFPYKGIFTCYSCGSGVVGEEKNRMLTNGEKRKHVYYHCSRYRNLHCKEPYLDENEFTRYLTAFIDEISEESLVIPAKLLTAMGEYEKLVKDTIYNNSEVSKHDIEVSIKDYAKYIIREGTNSAKRELILILPIPKLLHNRELV